MIKRILFICLVFIGLANCDDPYKNTTFVEVEEVPNGTYLANRASDFSEWIKVLDYTDLFNAINEASETFTVFAPTNEAVQAFYKEKGVTSIEELGLEYARELVKFHLINQEIAQKTFLLGGRLTYPTLTEDYLSVSFNESDAGVANENTVVLNGEAGVKEIAISTINGLVYVLNKVLTPLTETLYNRVEASGEYSIFKAAIDATGINELLSTTYDTIESSFGRKSVIRKKYTLFAVSDQVYAKEGITDLNSLAKRINASSDYTNAENALNKYVAYHIISSTHFAEDLFDFNVNDTILLWNTQAPNEVMSTTNIEGQDYLNFDDTDSTGIQLTDKEKYVMAKNGIIHQVNSWMPIFSPKTTTTYWDFCDYPELESIVNKWGSEKGYGECFQQYQYDQKNKIFDIDISSRNLDFFTYSATSCNYNWSNVGYCVLGRMNDYKVNFFGSADLNDGAYKDDIMIVNVGYMGKLTITSPTILKGKYKVTLYYGYASSMQSFYRESAVKCKFTLDNESVETNIYDKDMNIVNAIRNKELWKTVEFKENASHTFSIVVMDPRASSYNQYHLFLDYIKFEPVE